MEYFINDDSNIDFMVRPQMFYRHKMADCLLTYKGIFNVVKRTNITLRLQVACMQFINIVVHSVENMNFRVHLQYEFTHLSLDKYLEVSVSVVYRLCIKWRV